MFRAMRRKLQILPPAVTEAILQKASTGVLAVSGDDGYPYAVPLNFVYYKGKIYFHGAKEGHKLDAIKRNNKVSLCVVAEDNVHIEEFTTYYRSVIAFGKARIVTEKELKIEALQALVAKHGSHLADARVMQEIVSGVDHCLVVEISIEHLTGKENKDLALQRRQEAQVQQ